MILSKAEHAAAVDKAVFPMMQGGPMMHVIAAKAVALKECMTPEYQAYAKNVIENAQVLTSELVGHGLRAVTGGTDTHLALLDLQGIGVTGKEAEARSGASGIVLNKNSIPYDPAPPSVSSGIRIGTPSVTTQGMGTDEMKQVASFIARAINTDSAAEHAAVKEEVNALVSKFPAYPRP
jgi:glycine hydroxymethyltransferase